MNLNQEAFSDLDDSPAPDLSVVFPVTTNKMGSMRVSRGVVALEAVKSHNP
jgi:hypothetical protein